MDMPQAHDAHARAAAARPYRFPAFEGAAAVPVRAPIAPADGETLDRLLDAVPLDAGRFGVEIALHWRLSGPEALPRDEDARLFPAFEAASGHDGFWVLIWQGGDLVASAGAALLAPAADLHGCVTRGLYLHRPEDRFELHGLAADLARQVRGRFAFSGNVWVRGGERGSPFSDWVVRTMPSFCRALATRLWGVDAALTFVRNGLALRLVPKILCTVAMPEVRMYRSGALQRGGHVLVVTTQEHTVANAAAFRALFDRRSAQAA